MELIARLTKDAEKLREVFEARFEPLDSLLVADTEI